MKVRWLDLAYGGVFFGATLCLYWVSVVTGTDARRISSDPMWYPKVLLVMLGLCSALLIVRAAMKPGGERSRALAWKPLLIALSGAAAFLAAFPRLGYVPSALLLIPVMSWLLGFRRPVWLATTTLLFTIGLWYAFHYLLGATPPGPGLPTLG